MLLKKLLLIFTLLLCCNLNTYATITYITEVVDKGNDDKGDVDVPSSVQTDDVMLVQVTIRDSGGSDWVSAPNGWNQIGSQLQDDDVFHSIYYRVATSGEANSNYEWDFAGNGSRRYIIVMTVFRGVDSSNPIDTEASQTGMNGDEVTAPSVTTANENSMLVGFYSLEEGNGYFSPAAGMTEIYDEETGNNNNGLTTMAAYAVQNIAGSSGNKRAEASKSNDDAIGHLVALNEGSSSFTPMSCTASSPAVVFSDNFSSVNNGWQAVDFDRSISNWPSDNIVNTSGEKQYIDFSISGNELSIDGENEYGMVGIDLSAENINKTFVNEYVLSVDVTANKSGNNNDVGLVFGYVDDSNYYLARWTKYGTSYSNNSSFPGIYRRLELVKISSGSATTMASLDNFNPSDPFNLKVVVNDQGSLVCVDNNELLYSATEQPILNNIGLYSYDNDLGVSLDNVEVRCDDCAMDALLAYYAMDEASWSGAAGEVIDETGNYNAQAENGADTANSASAVTGNPGTCGYAEFDGVNDYVAIPDFDNLQGSFTITAWINPSNLQSGSRIFTDDENNNQKGYGFSLSDGTGLGHLRFYSRNVTPISVDTNNGIVNVNTWTFVTAVHNADNKTRQIYVNGVAQTLTSNSTSPTYSGNWGTDNGIASIGGETDSGETANRFTGNIDEVRIYSRALSQSEISAIKDETHPCAVYLDHFEIDVIDAQGLTCEADNITIKACADASCSTLNSDANDVQLSINGNYHKTVSVVGSTNTTIDHSTAEAATLSLDQSYECVNGVSASCDVIFSDTGFRFFAGTESTPILIPTQLSGKPSKIGFNASTLTMQAIKKSPETGACQAAFIDNNTIEMVATCVDPTTCAGSQVTINNLSTDFPIDTLNNTASKTYTDVALGFSNDTVNIAEFILTYPDAGKIQLHARYNILDENGNQTDNYMEGSSNAFVVRPFGFQLDFSQDLDSAEALASSALGSDFKKAGETFSLRAVAKQWAANQDNDNDGIPDDFTDLSTNNIAKNFNNEKLNVTRELFLPDPATANTGVLTPETNDSFSASILDNNYNFSEVGIIHLSAFLADSNYMGSGNIQGYIANVGRFTPAYFIQTVEDDGDLNAKHSLSSATCGMQNWAYSGQETDSVGTITYGLPPEILITAYNADGVITENYTYSGFMKLMASGIKVTLPTEDFEKERITPDVLAEKIKITSVMTSGGEPVVKNLYPLVDRSGVLNYEFNSSDHFIYEHNEHSKYSAFPAKIPFEITQVKDDDQIDLYDGSDPGIIPSAKQVLTEGVNIHFGRWYIENSFGPETSTLPMPMYVQNWNGTKFDINTDDNCTVPNIESEINTGGIWGGGLTEWQYRLLDASTAINEPIMPEHIQVTAPNPLTAFSDGVYREFIFSSPGDGNRGSLNIEYEVPTWLKYDWQNNGNFEDNPTAIATFGLFRGNDRIIYQREVNN